MKTTGADRKSIVNEFIQDVISASTTETIRNNNDVAWCRKRLLQKVLKAYAKSTRKMLEINPYLKSYRRQVNVAEDMLITSNDAMGMLNKKVCS